MMLRKFRTARRVWREAGMAGLRLAAARRLGAKAPVKPKTRKSVYGPRFIDNPGDTTFAFYIKGSYGWALWSHIEEMNEPFDFLDIGANQGLYSVGAALNEQCQRIVAMEPVPATAQILRQNLALNKVAPARYHVIEAALSDTAGEATIHVKPGHSGAATLASGNGLSDKPGLTDKIRTIMGPGLDTALPAAGPRLAVKIDVEGHETIAIEQLLTAACAPRIAWIVCEVTPKWTDAKALRETLKAAGFRLRKLTRGNQFELLAERRA